MGAKVDRVLVGIDGTAPARRALEWAMVLATASGGEVVAVHAVGLLVRPSEESEPVAGHSHLEVIRQQLESDWCSSLIESGLPYRLLVAEGPAGDVILAAAEREDADMIVVGSRGAGGFAELLLGSTSLRLLELADRPVLVIPAIDHVRPVGSR